MTVLEAINLHANLSEIGKEKISGKVAYAIARNITLLEKGAVSDYYTQLGELVKAYDIKDNGGRYNFEGESEVEFKKLIDREIKIDLHLLSIQDVESIANISVPQMLAINCVINVD